MSTELNFFEDYTAYIEKYRGYERREPDELFDELIKQCGHIWSRGKELIKKSYSVAKRGHEGQLRKSGTPYITHPLIVALMMTPYRPCAILLSATLLHDILEDTKETHETIADIHPDIVEIVEGVTKICLEQAEDIPDEQPEEVARFETMRKILTSSQKDIRILYLKVFDRMHNMITIKALSPKKIIKMAEETKYIYVPLAKRCWLRKIYHFLKGTTTEILEPEKWETLRKLANTFHPEILEKTEKIQTYIRAQHWSKKILQTDADFASPFSIKQDKENLCESWYAIRIVVQNASDCYSILHDIATRQDEQFIKVWHTDDLINFPRLSGYIWLHFEVIFEGATRFYLRIIDKKTHEKVTGIDTLDQLGKIYAPVLFRDFDLINEATSSNSREFMESVTDHILARKVPLHSKEKPVFYLPIKSTILDAIMYLEPKKFAYIGSMRKNNDPVPPYTPLENDDIITYDFSDEPTIDRSWLEYVHSWVSHWKIEQYIKNSPHAT